MNKITILIAIVLLAGCAGMRSGTSSYGASGTVGTSGASGSPGTYAGQGYSSTGNSSTYGYGTADAGRVWSQSHTVPYAEDPFPSFTMR